MIKFIQRKSTGVMADVIAGRDPMRLEQTRKRMVVACNISNLIESKGWSIAQFAEKFSMTEDEVSLWLEGQTNFDIDTLTKISLILDVDVQALLEPIKEVAPKPKRKLSKRELATV